MLILSTRDKRWLTQCEAVLASEGILFSWTSSPVADATCLEVTAEDGPRATEALSEQLGEDLRGMQDRQSPTPRLPLLLNPAFAAASGAAALTLAFFVVTGALGTDSAWQAAGALVTQRLAQQEWWRLVTAATLHSDWSHAISNAVFFLVLLWGASERLGPGVAALCWLTTALVGFGASLAWGEAQVTVGASGGLFGLLAAAAGHALRHRRAAPRSGRDILRVLGGAVLLLAFTAFSPDANIAAHLGGFGAGLGGGWWAPARPPRWAVQLICASLCGGAIWLAWSWALAS